MLAVLKKSFLLFVLCAPWMLCAQYSSITQLPGEVFFGRKYVGVTHIARYFKLVEQSTSKQFRLLSEKKQTVVSLAPDKRTSTINGMPVILNFAPTWQRGAAYLSYSDLATTVRPLVQRSALKKHTPMHIMIDPGHGGNDPGAIGKISKEKNVTMAFARDLEKALKQKGFKVTMTRTGDYTVSLTQRSAHANRVGAQLFISIHADAAAASVSGIGTFAMTPQGAPSYNTNKVESGTSPGHSWSNNSLFLAYCVQSNMARAVKPTTNRGLKRARFAVLRETKCPAVLIETGFISNVAEERKLNDPAYRKKIVDGIVAGVVEYKNAVRSR